MKDLEKKIEEIQLKATRASNKDLMEQVREVSG